MPRKPAAATPRSETTAALIARISAERDAPVTPERRTAGRSRTGVLDAPATVSTRRSADPSTRATRRRAATDGVPGADEQRAAPPRPLPLPPRPSAAGAVPGSPPSRRRIEPTPSIPRQRAAPRNRAAFQPPVDDVLADPMPDDNPTVVFDFVAPAAPPRRGLAHRLVPLAIGAAAMIGITVATAQGFTWSGFTDPGPRVGDTGAVLVGATVPEPAVGGPTVPAPVGSAPEDAAPQDAAPADGAPADGAPADGAVTVPEQPAAETAPDPQSDVSRTDAAVPAYDY